MKQFSFSLCLHCMAFKALILPLGAAESINTATPISTQDTPRTYHPNKGKAPQPPQSYGSRVTSQDQRDQIPFVPPPSAASPLGNVTASNTTMDFRDHANIVGKSAVVGATTRFEKSREKGANLPTAVFRSGVSGVTQGVIGSIPHKVSREVMNKTLALPVSAKKGAGAAIEGFQQAATEDGKTFVEAATQGAKVGWGTAKKHFQTAHEHSVNQQVRQAHKNRWNNGTASDSNLNASTQAHEKLVHDITARVHAQLAQQIAHMIQQEVTKALVGVQVSMHGTMTQGRLQGSQHSAALHSRQKDSTDLSAVVVSTMTRKKKPAPPPPLHPVRVQ